MAHLVDVFLHLDRYLVSFVGLYGGMVYAALFLIVFAETGLVVTPFLPGDSLLFATGALAASGMLDVRVALAVLLAAAVLGDRKSTRLNSSHQIISYAVFCLK